MARRRFLIEGIVQGVGFRPFVFGLARRHGLGGFVLNDGRGVAIEAEGPPEALDAFAAALGFEAPSLARVDAGSSSRGSECLRTAWCRRTTAESATGRQWWQRLRSERCR
jgi:hydrogenase maturation factor HypF (carbamoyltransferase family)